MCDEGAPAEWAVEREGERAQSQSNRVQDGVFRSLSICVTLPLTEVDDLCTAGFSLSTWRMSPGGATYNKSVLPAAGKSSHTGIAADGQCQFTQSLKLSMGKPRIG